MLGVEIFFCFCQLYDCHMSKLSWAVSSLQLLLLLLLLLLLQLVVSYRSWTLGVLIVKL